jgi:hypothetical protein
MTYKLWKVAAARVRRLSAGLLVAGATLGLTAGTASAQKIYDNIHGNVSEVSSIGFEATSTSEFGGQVAFAKTARIDPTVTIVLNSWACQNLKGEAECSTTPGASFSWPITLNVYGVEADGEPGQKIATLTEEPTIPYRPSPNRKCKPAPGEKWVGWGPKCLPDKGVKVSFPLEDVELPETAIISVAYNTTTYGYAPVGPGDEKGEDSLNVGVTEPPGTPSAGTDPLPEDAYVDSTYPAMYGPEPHGAIGTFSLANEWTGYQPLFEVTAG